MSKLARRLYEPKNLTVQEKRDKARVKGKCPRGSSARYCRLIRCIRTVEGKAKKDRPRSPVAVCRASIYSSQG